MADTRSLRSRQVNMATSGEANGQPTSPPRAPAAAHTKRPSPYLPTRLETLALLVYPALLVFGTLFSALSPQTRAARYDAAAHAHAQGADEVPSYFARKDNVFNTLFVKRGWAWVTVAFAVFALAHPALGSTARRTRAALRWALVTAWWFLVTQWCFGPAIIDRGFRFTGGKCDAAVAEGGALDGAGVFTAAACKAAGGRWSGGHDISGHVFLLVLGSYFLLQEIGWVVYRAGGFGGREERSIVMHDGAVKGAGVEAERSEGGEQELGLGGKFVLGVVGLCWWMLLMTAIYFHTWFEKLTGLLVAFMAIYPVYILPRWIPALRAFIGLPGI
ncbi:inositol phospholipid synthesis and fat-storage-inducing TM-domain-containing protein [Xylariaceae sp. FL0662B]|nr:inositol phospholipid synthesis and fat-storage-inducing TM-domain-containing protein [Xylariaceae sp. FL0662B]